MTHHVSDGFSSPQAAAGAARTRSMTWARTSGCQAASMTAMPITIASSS
ncbi:hypothetical protein [Streptomyces sp. NBC_01615]